MNSLMSIRGLSGIRGIRPEFGSGWWGERTRPCKKSRWQLHIPRQIERFLECESGAVAFTLAYLEAEKDFLHSLVPASRRHEGGASPERTMAP